MFYLRLTQLVACKLYSISIKLASDQIVNQGCCRQAKVQLSFLILISQSCDTEIKSPKELFVSGRQRYGDAGSALVSINVLLRRAQI